jgi:hypothetical protein
MSPGSGFKSGRFRAEADSRLVYRQNALKRLTRFGQRIQIPVADRATISCSAVCRDVTLSSKAANAPARYQLRV